MTLVLTSSGAGATTISFTGSISGAGLGPWSGSITGNSNVFSYAEVGPEQTWIVDAQLTADPPFVVAPLRSDSVHAMWRLIKFVVDHISVPYDPAHPFTLQALTGNDYTATVTSGAPEATTLCEATSIGSTVGGTFSVEAMAPLLDADPHYVLQGIVEPGGPGTANLTGDVTFYVDDVSTLTVPISIVYSFDLSLVLASPYSVWEEARYVIADDGVDLGVRETIIETSLEPSPSVETTWGEVKALFYTTSIE